MDVEFFFLAPVKVVKVTKANMEEVAEWCGGRVAETESRRNPGKMDRYVWVPTSKNSNISCAYPGMFVTKRLVYTINGDLRSTWAVYRRDYFEKNYFETPIEAVDAVWPKEHKDVRSSLRAKSPGPDLKTVRVPAEVTVNGGEPVKGTVEEPVVMLQDIKNEVEKLHSILDKMEEKAE